MVRLAPLAAALPATIPFVGPEAQERRQGFPFRARLGANESGFGPSPRAVEAISQAAQEAWMYGDPEVHALRQDIGRRHRVPPDAVVVGGGIDGLLGTLVRLLVGPGDGAVTSAGSYPTFNYHVSGHGGVLHAVPYRDDRTDPEALIVRAYETGAKLVYLANPDNPMGGWHGPATIDAMLSALPDGCLLCLDEAYADLAPGGALTRIDPWDRRVIRMRTLSKAHGLAGLRVGYAIGHPDLIAAFDRVRDHFGVGRVAQAGARAALADTAWVANVRRRVEESRRTIASLARENGLTPLPSGTNFVAVDCGRDGDFARRVLAELGARGVFVRMPGVAPLDRCIRISCGPKREMAVLRAVLPEALQAARAALAPA